MPERTFNLYNKSGTKVASGKSPLQLLDLVEDTDYKKGDYTITAQEYSSESTPVDVPAFRTKASLKLTIEGVETTGTYLTKDISQADYLALATKDNNTLYRVQPTDSGSGRVHFLGDKIVDLTRKGDTALYSRNLIKGSSSEWVSSTFDNTWDANITNISLTKPILENKKYTSLLDISNNSSKSVNLCVQYNFSDGTAPYKSYSKAIAIGGSDIVTTSYTPSNPVTTAQFAGKANQALKTDTINYRKLKFIQGDVSDLSEWVLAPEDILATTTTIGGGTFG